MKFKGALSSGLGQFLTTESPLKMMKNAYWPIFREERAIRQLNLVS